MWSDAFTGIMMWVPLLLGLAPVAMFGRVLIQAGAPDPHDRQPSRWDGWFPLRGRWRRLFFLAVQFVCVAPFLYLCGVVLGYFVVAFVALTVRAIVEVVGAS